MGSIRVLRATLKTFITTVRALGDRIASFNSLIFSVACLPRLISVTPSFLPFSLETRAYSHANPRSYTPLQHRHHHEPHLICPPTSKRNELTHDVFRTFFAHYFYFSKSERVERAQKTQTRAGTFDRERAIASTFNSKGSRHRLDQLSF